MDTKTLEGRNILLAISRSETQPRIAAAAAALVGIVPRVAVVVPDEAAWRGLIGQHGWEGAYHVAVERVDAVVALERNGRVGRGVYSLVTEALAQHRPAFALRRGADQKPRLVEIVAARESGAADWTNDFGILRAA